MDKETISTNDTNLILECVNCLFLRWRFPPVQSVEIIKKTITTIHGKDPMEIIRYFEESYLTHLHEFDLSFLSESIRNEEALTYRDKQRAGFFLSELFQSLYPKYASLNDHVEFFLKLVDNNEDLGLPLKIARFGVDVLDYIHKSNASFVDRHSLIIRIFERVYSLSNSLPIIFDIFSGLLYRYQEYQIDFTWFYTPFNLDNYYARMLCLKYLSQKHAFQFDHMDSKFKLSFLPLSTDLSVEQFKALDLYRVNIQTFPTKPEFVGFINWCFSSELPTFDHHYKGYTLEKYVQMKQELGMIIISFIILFQPIQYEFIRYDFHIQKVYDFTRMTAFEDLVESIEERKIENGDFVNLKSIDKSRVDLVYRKYNAYRNNHNGYNDEKQYKSSLLASFLYGYRNKTIEAFNNDNMKEMLLQVLLAMVTGKDSYDGSKDQRTKIDNLMCVIFQDPTFPYNRLNAKQPKRRKYIRSLFIPGMDHEDNVKEILISKPGDRKVTKKQELAIYVFTILFGVFLAVGIIGRFEYANYYSRLLGRERRDL
jgi:hypothetical protein